VTFESNQLPETNPTLRIDAHHHFWHYTPEEYEWIDGSMTVLQRDFLAGDLEELARTAEIDGVVSVQARQSLEETQWLLHIAEMTPLVRGVVGWAPIAAKQFAATLETLSKQPLLKGLRHLLQAEPDAYMLSSAFNDGLALMKDSGLVYDVLVVERQLAAAIEMIDRHPSQVFVLDHVAKPPIAAEVLEPWRSHMRELAKREHVYCKLSGMVTEADWQRWSVEGLQPYVDTVLECFGPPRLMAGSDWPVCTLATTYAGWLESLQMMLRGLSSSERNRVLGGTAMQVYRLNDR
jgi:L-fuconolactonase